MGPRNDDIRTELTAAINLQAFNFRTHSADGQRLIRAHRKTEAGTTNVRLNDGEIHDGVAPDFREGRDGGHEAIHGNSELGSVVSEGEGVVACNKGVGHM